MKKIIATLYCLVLVLSLSASQIIVAGKGTNFVTIADMHKQEILWQHPLQSKEYCNSLDFIKSKKNYIAFSTQIGAKVVDLNHKVIYEYKVPDVTKFEIHCVMALDGGGLAIFQAGETNELILLNEKFERAGGFKFEGGNKHKQFRQCALSSKGTWLIPNFMKKRLDEYNAKGECINSYPVGYSMFYVRESMDSKQFLLSLGFDGKYGFYDREQKKFVNIISEFKGEQFGYSFAAQFEQIAEDKYLIASWDLLRKRTPQVTLPAAPLVIFNDKNEIIWFWDNSKNNLGYVSAFYYTEKPIIK